MHVVLKNSLLSLVAVNKSDVRLSPQYFGRSRRPSSGHLM